jgi:hypothetical protein
MAMVSLALVAWVAAASLACSTFAGGGRADPVLAGADGLVDLAVRHWTPGFSCSCLAAPTICWYHSCPPWSEHLAGSEADQES